MGKLIQTGVRRSDEENLPPEPRTRKTRRQAQARVIRGTVRRGTGSDQAAQAQHMGTGERGCQECDGERRGRGRVLAAGRRREKKFHAANPQVKKAGASACRTG